MGPAASVTPAQTGGTGRTSPDRPATELPDVKPPGFVAPPDGPAGLDRYVNQRVSWSSCDEGECARIAVPLDYSRPDDQAITLALSRVRATASPKLGTLLVNPGGPGESGLWLASGLRRTGLEQYDILAWDPRGSGQSTPVACENGRAVDDFLALDASPDDQAETDALLAATRAFAAGCVARSGKLLAHVSSADTVADMELLRRLSGDKALNFLGYSYGTYLGALYAQTYPTSVGRLVLDSPVNITDDQSIIQANGFDKAFGVFADWCAAKACSLGSTPVAVRDSVVEFLERLDAKPVPAGSRYLTQTLGALGIAAYLYGSKSNYEPLRAGIEAARKGDGKTLLSAADRLEGRQSDGNYSAFFFAFWAIGCSDEPDAGIAGSIAEWRTDQAKAPIFAKYLGPDLTCPLWPVKPRPEIKITAPGTPTILIVGATGDSATPYTYAVWMAAQLTNAVLLTYDGEGHATYGIRKNSCIDNAVVAYLAQGTLPRRGTVCPA